MAVMLYCMNEELLTEREHRVLEAVVRNYILSASPTGSRFLSKQPDFDSSPATIRNIMGDLEERGFIAQPHTSAGRIPTDKGYRYYVDCMMKSMELPAEVKSQINDYLTRSNRPICICLWRRRQRRFRGQRISWGSSLRQSSTGGYSGICTFIRSNRSACCCISRLIPDL